MLDLWEIQENVDNEFKTYCQKPGCFCCNPDTAETQAEDRGDINCISRYTLRYTYNSC